VEYRSRSSTQFERERNTVLPKPSRSPEAAAGSAVRNQVSGIRSQRLTAVGCGVLILAATMAGGSLDKLLFNSSGVLLGMTYIAVSFHASVRVRSSDLAAAPISGPICLAFALFFFGKTTGSGWARHLIGLAEALALDAGWLFAGTAVSVAIALARHVSLVRARRKASS
jgi:hypothetical protein